MDTLADLIRSESFFYADCIALSRTRVIGYTIAGARLALDDLIGIDESDVTDAFERFSIEIDGAIYAGGEGASHGSYGFFYKRTGNHVDWVVMSTTLDPFVAARRTDGAIAFVTQAGDAWVVSADDVVNLRIDRGQPTRPFSATPPGA